MNGKIVPVGEFDLTFGNTTKLLEIYAVFKYKKNGNLYIVYKNQVDKSNILSFGSAHFKDNSIVIISIKEKEIDVIKEFIDNFLLNNISMYEIMNLDNANKAEIISENKLTLEENIIIKLNEMTIPKPVVEEISIDNNNKKKNIVIVIIIFLLLIMGAIAFIVFKDKIFNTNRELMCYREYKHDVLNTNMKEEYTFSFVKNNDLTTVKKTTSYMFNISYDYFNFKNQEEYKKYMEVGSSPTFDDENKTYKETIDINDPDIPMSYDRIIPYYEEKGYVCNGKKDG